MAQRGYNLHTVLEYGNIVQEAGFRFVSAVDETDFMVKMLEEELVKLANMKDEFIKVNLHLTLKKKQIVSLSFMISLCFLTFTRALRRKLRIRFLRRFQGEGVDLFSNWTSLNPSDF